MSLATISELQARLEDGSSLSSATLAPYLAAVTSAIERYCNSYFGRRPSSIVAGDAAKFICPGHGLQTGDYVKITGETDTNLNGTHEVTVVPGNPESFTIDVTTAETTSTGLVRRRMTRVLNTRGGEHVTLEPRPVGEVTEVKESSTPNVFTTSTALLATSYMLDLDAETHSVSGILYRLDGEWPYRISRTLNKTRQIALGALQVQFIPGAPIMPPDIIDAAVRFAALVYEQGSSEPVASENLEYYSYSLLTGEAAASVPHSLVASLNRHRRIAA